MRIIGQHFAVVAIAMLIGIGLTLPSAKADAPAGAEQLVPTMQWDTPEQWVAGMPIWIGVTVSMPKGSTLLLGSLREPQPMTFHSFTWQLRGHADDVVVAERKRAPIGQRATAVMDGLLVDQFVEPPMQISHEPVRLLLLVSTGADVPSDEGRYVLQIRLHDAMGQPVGPAHEAIIKLRTPTAPEAKLVQNWPKQGLHAAAQVASIAETDLPATLVGESGAAFELAVRQLLLGQSLAGELSVRLETVPPVLKQESQVLRWWSETIVDEQAASVAEEKIRKTLPQLAWRLGEIRQWIIHTREGD